MCMSVCAQIEYALLMFMEFGMLRFVHMLASVINGGALALKGVAPYDVAIV